MVSETSPADALSNFLQGCGAVTASDVARCLGLEVDAVHMELEQLVRAGRVEVLRPIPRPGCQPGAMGGGTDLEYYRWIRSTDVDYVWQRALLHTVF